MGWFSSWRRGKLKKQVAIEVRVAKAEFIPPAGSELAVVPIGTSIDVLELMPDQTALVRIDGKIGEIPQSIMSLNVVKECDPVPVPKFQDPLERTKLPKPDLDRDDDMNQGMDMSLFAARKAMFENAA